MEDNMKLKFSDIQDKVILFSIGIIIILVVLYIMINNKYIFGSGSIRRMIKNETFLVYVDSKKCDNCAEVQRVLDENKVKYTKVSLYSDDADELFKEIKFVDYDNVVPGLFYITDGSVYSNMFNIEDMEELQLFIDNYELGNK